MKEKLGQVILGWKKGRRAKGFANILLHFVPPPAVIVDLCSGHKNMYRYFNDGNTLDKDKYFFVFSDIKQFRGNDFIASCCSAPLKSESADGVVFDPPWPSQSGSLADMLHKYSPMENEEDFLDFLGKAIPEVERILKVGGYLVFKCKAPYTHIFYHKTNLKWIRDIPSISVMRGVYLPVYFMVFQKTGGQK